MTSNPIPGHFAQGFRDALGCYRTSRWLAALYPGVNIEGKSFTISQVCDLVEGFTDELPKDVLQSLLEQMDTRYDHLKVRLNANPTYQIGARCLRTLVQDKEAEYRALHAPPKTFGGK